MTKIPDSQKVLSVGYVGTGPYSFYGTYTHAINTIFRTYNYYNMRITHIWGDDYAKNYKGSPEFMKKWKDFWSDDKHSPEAHAKIAGIPNVCSDFSDMVDEVDAAMIMDYDRAYELSEPFLKAGKPIYIVNPVAKSIPECERILDLAESTGTAVYTGSYTQDKHDNRILDLKVKRDEIASYFSMTAFAFYTSYANDGLDPLHRLIGGGVRKVSLHGWDGSHGYEPHDTPVCRIHLEHEPRGDHPPIQGVLTLGGYRKYAEWYKVYYHDNTILEGIDNTNWSKFELTVRDLLLAIQEVFATNKSLETRDDILQKLRVNIAAYKSANEGGRPVDVNEVGDFQLPTVRIEKWDEIPE
ncbi:Gfo/Idh/MocA family oxidoreductase [Candidatus Latescibacterota bacterium]